MAAIKTRPRNSVKGGSLPPQGGADISSNACNLLSTLASGLRIELLLTGSCRRGHNVCAPPRHRTPSPCLSLRISLWPHWPGLSHRDRQRKETIDIGGIQIVGDLDHAAFLRPRRLFDGKHLFGACLRGSEAAEVRLHPAEQQRIVSYRLSFAGSYDGRRPAGTNSSPRRDGTVCTDGR